MACPEPADRWRRGDREPVIQAGCHGDLVAQQRVLVDRWCHLRALAGHSGQRRDLSLLAAVVTDDYCGFAHPPAASTTTAMGTLTTNPRRAVRRGDRNTGAGVDTGASGSSVQVSDRWSCIGNAGSVLVCSLMLVVCRVARPRYTPRDSPKMTSNRHCWRAGRTRLRSSLRRCLRDTASWSSESGWPGRGRVGSWPTGGPR